MKREEIIFWGVECYKWVTSLIEGLNVGQMGNLLRDGERLLFGNVCWDK